MVSLDGGKTLDLLAFLAFFGDLADLLADVFDAILSSVDTRASGSQQCRYHILPLIPKDNLRVSTDLK